MISEEDIFEAAGALAGPERAAYLDGACAGQPEMRARLEALLRSHDVSGFMEENAMVAAGRELQEEWLAPEPEQRGERIGHYKLLEEIGQGGFGVVWVAEQSAPVRRRVALKIIKPGMDSREVIARFEQERQALAMMDHPNIAKVFDAGATEKGRPYFVMELVRGARITDYCDEAQLPAAERLQLFITVCQAVQHAHQKGIIHRDLKPSNILVARGDDGEPIPKVIDFGVAKAMQPVVAGATIYTQFEQMIGTPAYMSPEQAGLAGLDIDTRSDVYSLGVLLYELLTGRPPFEARELLGAGLDEMRRVIREVEPPKPSTRRTQLLNAAATSGKHPAKARILPHKSSIVPDLDWIVMKALEKNRTRRYETASALAADLQRFLNHEPVSAGPPGFSYRAGKLIRRHRIASLAAAGVLVSLVGGLGTAAVWWLKERAALAAETELREKAEAGRRAAQEENAKNAQIVTLLEQILEGAGPPAPEGEDTTLLRRILESTVKRVDAVPSDQREVEAHLRHTIGRAYSRMAMDAEARTQLAKAMEIYRRLPGPEPPVLEKLRSDLGAVERRLNVTK